MASSQNGWRANDRSVITTSTVPGTSVKLAVRQGAPGQLLIAAAARWHREVEPLVAGTCWGYAERTIRGSSTTLSNHASGTAIDLNAPQHPLAITASRNFSGAEIVAVRRIIDSTRGVLRWGGDYDQPSRGGRSGGRPDPMHIEVNDGQDEQSCRNALGWIGGSSPAPAPAPAPSGGTLQRGSTGDAVKRLQSTLKAKYRAYAGDLVVDGDYGPATEAAVREFQRRSGLTADGIAGPVTLRALGL